MNNLPLILASSSSSRLKLLNQIHFNPDIIDPADIDESVQNKELPHKLALRLAIEKRDKICKSHENGFIIAADTVSACGRRILPKAQNDEEVLYCLNLLSGRRHQVYTGVAVCRVENNLIIHSANRLVKTILRFKRLSKEEINHYIKNKEGIGKSGGCSITGCAESFVLSINGSYSNIVGLPLYETKSLLTGIGYIQKD